MGDSADGCCASIWRVVGNELDIGRRADHVVGARDGQDRVLVRTQVIAAESFADLGIGEFVRSLQGI